MKTVKSSVVMAILFSTVSVAQDITFVATHTSITDTLGKEIVFDLKITNVSSSAQTVFLLRTINSLPSNWSSSLCFGSNCYASFLDSVATTQDFASSPVQPGEERDVSVHVFTASNNGTADIQVVAGTTRNSNSRIPISLTASTIVTSIRGKSNIMLPKSHSLFQNYPNPFNPATTIGFELPIASNVKLSVFDLLGREVVTLVNEKKEAGTYSVVWDAKQVSSGIYFYTVQAGEFRYAKRMVLIK